MQPIDFVLILHAQYDHLDMPSLRRLAELQPDIKVLSPLGVGRYASDAGFANATEFDWWQDATLGEMTVTATPARHWASRSPFDRNRTLWAAFMMRFSEGFKFYFIGDTGYGEDFANVRERLGPADLFAIPVRAYAPSDFMKVSHCNSEKAVLIFQLLGAEHAVAIHWGTFKLNLDPLEEPPILLDVAFRQSRIDDGRFRALVNAERWTF